jgi:hypothetical protein
MRRLLGLAAPAVIGMLLAPATGSAANAGFRIVDRTLICPMVGVGYPDSVRFITVGGNAFREEALYTNAPEISVRNGGTAPGSGVSAGVRTRPGSSQTTGAMWFTRTRCQQTKIRVPLSSRGLTGGPADRSGAYYRCDAPAKVLIRVRAVFKRPTALSRDARAPWSSVARGPVATGYLAVTTLRGRRPMVFASVQDEGGKARVFVARSGCSRNG